MYTKVTPKAGQNGPMWLYVGSTPTFLDFWLGITYNYFSMMVVGYMVKFQARFVLQRSPFQVIPTPCPWTQNLTCKVRRTRTQRAKMSTKTSPGCTASRRLRSAAERQQEDAALSWSRGDHDEMSSNNTKARRSSSFRSLLLGS